MQNFLHLEQVTLNSMEIQIAGKKNVGQDISIKGQLLIAEGLS